VPEELLVDGIRWGSVGPLLFISLAIMGSPGPATISLMAAGSAYGVRRSLSYLIGIIVGTTIVLLAVATGITAVLLAVPAIGSILIWISVAYILWLAYHDTATDAAAKIAVLTAMVIVICAIWLVAGTSIAPLLRDAGRARVVNVALAVALVGATALAVLH
jgi:threonine/homoserine/homoserine lactone efflux protein